MTAAPAETGSSRDRILSVALDLFALKGYEATSMREISEGVGMTKAALYYHFSSKDDIVNTLLGDLHDSLAEIVGWARERSRVVDLDTLRAEALTRWSDIVQARGLQLFRFVSANRYALQQTHPQKGQLRETVDELQLILAPRGTSVEEQLRVRMALASINLASMAGVGIDAPDEQILAAARMIAADLMPSAQNSAQNSAPSSAPT